MKTFKGLCCTVNGQKPSERAGLGTLFLNLCIFEYSTLTFENFYNLMNAT